MITNTILHFYSRLSDMMLSLSRRARPCMQLPTTLARMSHIKNCFLSHLPSVGILDGAVDVQLTRLIVNRLIAGGCLRKVSKGQLFPIYRITAQESKGDATCITEKDTTKDRISRRTQRMRKNKTYFITTLHL
jgi:hypothetical protein